MPAFAHRMSGAKFKRMHHLPVSSDETGISEYLWRQPDRTRGDRRYGVSQCDRQSGGDALRAVAL